MNTGLGDELFASSFTSDRHFFSVLIVFLTAVIVFLTVLSLLLAQILSDFELLFLVFKVLTSVYFIHLFAMINNSEDSNVQEETWGWGPYGSEEDVVESTAAISIEGTPSREAPIRRNTSAELKKSSSERSFNSRRQHSSQALKGIASSPSFQELEKAIGVALSQSTEDNGNEPKTLSPSTSFSSSKLSSTNLMQQKVMQHRVRQHQQLMNSYPNQGQRINNSAPGLKISTSSGNLSAKSELAPFINESESRALILFHSPTVPQNIIKDVCSKFGVLYYIRPEFHARGLTLLSYFDLQAALAAKDAIPTSLGPGADASVFYSIMLHATTSNTEEFRLIVKNLPDSASEMDIQTVFSRYGPLRSIQKTFGSSTDLAYGDARSVAVSYSVEFFNIQDARLAASELSATSTSIWGTDAAVRFAPLDERKKQLCKQLLGFLSRWRSEISSPMSSHPQFTSHQPGGQLAVPVASGTLPMSLPPQVHYPMIGTGSYQSMSSFQFGAPMEYGLIPQMTFQAPMLGTQLNPPMFPAMYGAPFSSPYGPPTFVTEHGNHGNMQLSVHPVVTDSGGLMVNGRDSFVSKPKDLQDKSGIYKDGSTDNTRFVECGELCALCFL